MDRIRIDRRRALAFAGTAWLAGAADAAAQSQSAQPTPTRPAPGEPHPLPPAATTHHKLELPDRTLQFTATAGAIRLMDDKGAARADLAFVAYQLDGTDLANRKVTFAFNGGPGFASGWLHVGAIGPWRIPLGGEATVPSASPQPIANVETWLDFTDLVFIDPAGTGYSRVLASSDEVRRKLWSFDGDIEYLAEAIGRWLDLYDRTTSPKYLLGESYGGFRVPRLARELAYAQGVGVSGMVMVSPALDFGERSYVFDPFAAVGVLPSMTAAARAAKGPVTRAQLADVEHYAATDFLVDLTRGERDAAAIARRSDRVAEFTGLDAALVRRYHGVINNTVFLHELDRAQGRVGSLYDAIITSMDPFPLETSSDYPDPVLEALKAPVSSAMVAIYETLLKWRPEADYRLWNQQAGRQWDWGHGYGAKPQSVGFMRTALALDPHVSVLIAHGLFDLVTPYFATQLLLDQIPEPGIADRVRFEVYPGGHMFYTNDASRAAFREASSQLMQAR